MCGNMADCNLLRIADSGVEFYFAEVVICWGVQVNLAAFGEDHESGSCDGFGDGCEGVEGVGCGGNTVFSIGPAETFFPEDFSFLGDGQGERRGAGFYESGANEFAERCNVFW